MRDSFAKEIKVLAEDNKNIVLLSGDIGNRMFDEYKKIASSRFINCGIAEANMMSMASGMALSGLRPVVYTITPFTTTRCLEQIKIGVAYHQAPVVIVGTGSGLSYSELGPTHHSLEDIAIIKSIPNINILTPSDKQELIIQLREALKSEYPSYIRIGKKGEPNLYNSKHELGIGKGNLLVDGSDYIVIGIGPIVSEALKASEIMKRRGKSLAVATIGSIRPLDVNFLEKVISKKFKAWITLEEHGINGGLGSTIIEWASDNEKLNGLRIKRLGVNSLFINELGNQNYTRKKLGLDKEGILRAIDNL
tara:strand:+ start:408 stop:1328 length:921 start_codon:yes stop_codon:yes gene_type:complete